MMYDDETLPLNVEIDALRGRTRENENKTDNRLPVTAREGSSRGERLRLLPFRLAFLRCRWIFSGIRLSQNI